MKREPFCAEKAYRIEGQQEHGEKPSGTLDAIYAQGSSSRSLKSVLS